MVLNVLENIRNPSKSGNPSNLEILLKKCAISEIPEILHAILGSEMQYKQY